MRALIIRQPWIDRILDGLKTWEIRSKSTNVRGRIGLIQGGSGTIVGTAELVDSVGPMSFDQLVAQDGKHQVPADVLAEFVERYGGRAFAWVLADIHRLVPPLRYEHPSGAVIWVTIDSIPGESDEG